MKKHHNNYKLICNRILFSFLTLILIYAIFRDLYVPKTIRDEIKLQGELGTEKILSDRNKMFSTLNNIDKNVIPVIKVVEKTDTLILEKPVKVVETIVQHDTVQVAPVIKKPKYTKLDITHNSKLKNN